MLKDLPDAPGGAQPAISPENFPSLQLIEAALTGIALLAPDLATRAVRFVAEGGDDSVLADLAAHNGAFSHALGRPGRARCEYAAPDIDVAAHATSRAGRNMLYRHVLNQPEQVAMLVRLGKVLAAADQLQKLDRTMAHDPQRLPDWLQYLLNDALWASQPMDGNPFDLAERAHWNVELLAALLAADGSSAPALPIIFEREAIDEYDRDDIYPSMLLPGVLDTYMLEHPQEVAAVAACSESARLMLIHRIGSQPPLLPAFAELLIRLAAGDNKAVRKLAATRLSVIDPAQALAVLSNLLHQGSAAERGHAAELLARTQGAAALPVLTAAWEKESSKPAREAIGAAITRLQAAQEAAALPAPSAPPLPPAPTQRLGEDVLALLLENQTDLLDELRQAAEQEIEDNRLEEQENGEDADTGDTHQNRYARYRQLDESMLRLALQALNGEGGEGADTARALLANRQVIRTLEYQDRLLAHPDFGLLQLLRQLYGADPERGAVWYADSFQAWLEYQDIETIDLRQLVALAEPCGGSAGSGDANALTCLSSSAPCSPQRVLPDERVWPVFAERPHLLDSGLGMAPWPKKHEYDNDVDSALVVLSTFPFVPARWVPRTLELALGDNREERALAQQALSSLPGIGKHVRPALQSSRHEVRSIAARWLADLDDREAIPELQAALEQETRDTVSATLLATLEQLGADMALMLTPARLLAEAQQGFAGIKNKLPASLDWLRLDSQDSLPACHWRDGTPVPPEILRWWVVLACKLKQAGGAAVFRSRLAQLAPASAAVFGSSLLRQFIVHDTRHPAPEQAMAWAEAQADHRLLEYHAAARRDPAQYGEFADTTREQVLEQLRREKRREYLGSAISEKGMLALTSHVAAQEFSRVVRAYERRNPGRRAQIEALRQAASAANDGSAVQFLLDLTSPHA